MNLLLEEIKLPEGSYTENYNGLKLYFESSATEKHKEKMYTLLKSVEQLLKSKNIKPLNNFIKDIIAVNSGDFHKRLDSRSWLGAYSSKDKALAIVVSSELQSKVGLSLRYHKNYIDYDEFERTLKIFIHELGHAIHLVYIDEESKNYWNDVSTLIIALAKKIKIETRKVMYDLKQIEDEIFNEEDIKNKFVENLDPDQDFDDVESIFSGKYNQEDIDKVDERIKRKEKKHKHKFMSILNFIESNIEELPEAFKDSFRLDFKLENFNKALNGSSTLYFTNYIEVLENIIKLLNRLHQTAYARSNDREDFAETFADYVFSPNKLSHWNYNRITSTLKKAKAKGKNIFIESNSLNNLRKYIELLLESAIK